MAKVMCRTFLRVSLSIFAPTTNCNSDATNNEKKTPYPVRCDVCIKGNAKHIQKRTPDLQKSA